jgi:hypothetical protein
VRITHNNLLQKYRIRSQNHNLSVFRRVEAAKDLIKLKRKQFISSALLTLVSAKAMSESLSMATDEAAS